MARLTALPSIDIIHGFQGILDFYYWRGLPCVRRWPRMTKAQQSQATIDAGILFGEVSSAYSLLAPLELAALQEAAKDQPRTARDLYMSAAYGHLHRVVAPPPPPPPEEQMYDAYVCLRDVKAQGTPGGTFTADAWRRRDLNDEQADAQHVCSLSGDHFTLAAGTYRAHISVPAYQIKHHQARLFNVTDAELVLLGTSEFAYDNIYVTTRCLIEGRFTIGATKDLQIQHYCNASKADWGFGAPCNFTDEIYTVAEFWREVPPA